MYNVSGDFTEKRTNRRASYPKLSQRAFWILLNFRTKDSLMFKCILEYFRHVCIYTEEAQRCHYAALAWTESGSFSGGSQSRGYILLKRWLKPR